MSRKIVYIYFCLVCCIRVRANLYISEIGSVVKYYERNKNLDELSEVCLRDFGLYANGLINKEQWALEMFDATSKLQSGILKGNLYNLGSFKECLSIKEVKSDDTIYGKYCLGRINLFDILPIFKHEVVFDETNSTNDKNNNTRAGPTGEFDTSLKWAACLPQTCNATEFQKILMNVTSLNMTFSDDSCQSEKTPPELNSGGIVTITLFGVILALVVISTIYDVFLYYTKQEVPHDMLIAFSALTNGRKIIKTTNNTEQLLCLNGIKAISMMWVIIGHGYAESVFGPVANASDVMEWMQKTLSMYIIGATVSVDTFFVVGGLLASYTFIKASDKGIKFNISLYYIHRYIRLTPALAAVILIHITLLLHLSSGPIYPVLMDNMMVKPCQNNWWAALLYIQNYYNYQEMCMPQTWYLSVDMQLFLISPILLLMLKNKPKFAVIFISILCVLSMVACFIVGWHFELGATIASQGGGDDQATNMGNFMKYYYVTTHTRMTPYLLGIILGYYIYQFKKSRATFSFDKFWFLLLWIFSLAVLSSVVFAGHNLVVDEYNKLEHTMFITFARPAWSLALCWVIFACIFNHGGPVNWFLSLPAFQILSKLSYTMYLLHYTFIMIKYTSNTTTHTFSDFNLMYNFWGDFCFSLALAVVWTLMFESPMITIEKYLFGKRTTPTTTRLENNANSKLEV